MGSSSHLYNLSWSEFSKSLACAAEQLRGHKEMVDVTLAAGGRSFPAHKIVLCAASPFLLDLLKSTPCQHPVIMLAGIGADDLESLLDFVYRGEVSVEPSQLPSLLQAAHCLNIQGLTPPTVLANNGHSHETSLPAIPVPNETVSRDLINSHLLLHGKKRRRKHSPSGKWHRPKGHTDIETSAVDGYSLENSTTKCEGKDNDDTAPGDDTVSERSEHSNNPSSQSPQPHQLMPITPEACQTTVQTEQSDVEPHLHTLMPMQAYSPLQIPSFHNALNISLPPSMPISIATPSSISAVAAAAAAAAGSSKARGASDCPGICPLCGATLRQARNLRRHLLYSCKYRFSNSTEHMHASAEAIALEIKPEVEIPGYVGRVLNYGTDSGGSNSCEHIVCNPSPLPSPSPDGSQMVSPHDSNMISSHGSNMVPSHDADMLSSHALNMVSSHDSDVLSSHASNMVSSRDSDVLSSHGSNMVSSHDPDMLSPHDSNMVSSHGSNVLSSHDLIMVSTHGSNVLSPHRNPPSPTVPR